MNFKPWTPLNKFIMTPKYIDTVMNDNMRYHAVQLRIHFSCVMENSMNQNKINNYRLYRYIYICIR